MPEPSRLVKLEQVLKLEAGSKVRFLGCVHAYDDKNAQIILCDRFPANERTVSTVIVSIDCLLDSLSYDLLEVGAWLNVVGNVRHPYPPATRREMRTRQFRQAKAAYLDATMIWSAGAIKLDKYQAAVTALQDTGIVGTTE